MVMDIPFQFDSYEEAWLVLDSNVPGHIQLQGYGRPQYTNVAYPWEGRESLVPPQIPKEFNPVGSYVKYFDFEKDTSFERTYISFQGVETAFYVWLNGHFIGYSEDKVEYIKSALLPATVKAVVMLDTASAKVYVAPEQLSLAIGRGGQNARLAAKLTGCKIDITGDSLEIEV